MIKAVLFDLDGTLLPMDQNEFVKEYFTALAAKMVEYGYEPEKLVATVWQGTRAMLKNDGSRTNEEAFWASFAEAYGEDALKNIPDFDAFYGNEFNNIKRICTPDPRAPWAVREIRSMGISTVLATSPIFPPVAAENRIRWAWLTADDFDYITTYSNCRYCKPTAGYYRAIADKLGLAPEECLMVGNDVGDDMPASDIGMHVYLLPTCLINKTGADISRYPQGNFDSLVEHIKTLI